MENETVEIKVDGMTCTGCAKTVSRFLEGKGLEDVQVNLTTHEVQFKWGESSASFSDIKSGIGKLGFEVSDFEKKEPSSKRWDIWNKFMVALVFTLPLFLGHILMMFGVHISFLENPWVQFFLCVPVFVIGILHFGRSAWQALKLGTSNMDVLIFIGSTSAFIYSCVGLMTQNSHYIFFETCASIITLVLLGNLLENKAIQQTTQAIDELKKLQSDDAIKVFPDGHTEIIKLKDVKKGDILQVNEGDAIPTDGRVLKGNGWLDESMLTGESELQRKQKGDKLTGASILSTGNLQLEVLAVGNETVLSRIIKLVKDAQLEEPDIQRLADKISAIFVPLVLMIAILTIPLGYYILDFSFTQSLMNAIAVLVISCPCAMGLATPAAIMVGVGRAAKEGILIKGSKTLEIFAHAKHMVFDKTGTLTEGKFKIQSFNVLQGDEKEIRRVVYSLEQHSSHPIAKSLVDGLKDEEQITLKDIKETKGLKLEAKDEKGQLWELGSYKLVSDMDVEKSHSVYVVKDGALVATIDLDDALKDNVNDMIQYFHQEEISSYILSGDREERVKAVAENVGIKHYEAQKLPEEKYARIRSLKEEDTTIMVGDGINDAAALAQADVGITFSSASDVAVQSAGIVLLNDSSETLVKAHAISKQTLKTIKENLFWAFAYNIVAIPIAALGFLNPMWGAMFMAFSDIVIIANSLRLKNKRI